MNYRTITVGAALFALILTVSGLTTANAQPQPGFGPGMMGGWRWSQPSLTTLQPITSMDEARQALQRYVDVTGNTDLTLGEIIEFQWNYYGVVESTSTGRGAFELLADPRTGAVFPEMGPAMMWNTEYGHMTGFGMMYGFRAQPSGPSTVSEDRAQEIAQGWLDQYQPGSAAEIPDTFPGYYTVHITNNGQITGMLSVNAYTGQVWYHSWHGAFVAASGT